MLVIFTRVVSSKVFLIIILISDDIVKMGLTYLRQCESAAYAQYLMQKTLAIHGTIHAEFKKIICDYDGAYGIYTVADGMWVEVEEMRNQ